MEIFGITLVSLTFLFLAISCFLKDQRLRKKDKTLKRFHRHYEIYKKQASQVIASYDKMCKNLNRENHKLQFENKRLNDIIQNVPEVDDDYSDEELADLIKNSDHVI